jgi:hypothetical protein
MNNKLANQIENEFGVELGIIKRINFAQKLANYSFYFSIGTIVGALCCGLFLLSVVLPRDYQNYVDIKNTCREQGFNHFKDCLKQLEQKQMQSEAKDLV